MENSISPKYQMKLLKEVSDTIWNEFVTYDQVRYYINKWHEDNYDPRGFNDEYWQNFSIIEKENRKIDLDATLHSMSGELLLKIAIDLGVDTPDFIPSIPTFTNSLKTDYKTAYDTFQKAYKLTNSDPGLAVGLANSALESIIKEILKDSRMSRKITGGETLYKLSSIILKELQLTSEDLPKEIKTIGNSFLAANQAIENLRSEKTNFHGKTMDDYLLSDQLLANFILNSVATVGLFIKSYYEAKFQPDQQSQNIDPSNDDLPF